MRKRKITKDDILAGNYLKRTSGAVKRQYRSTDLLLIYVKYVLFFGTFFALCYGYSVYRDSRLTRMITKEYPSADGKTTIKSVKLWTGDEFLVEDEYKKTGKILAGKYFYCPKAYTENLILTIKDENNLNVCMELTAITKPLRNDFNRMVKNKTSLKDEYINKTISVFGYGWTTKEEVAIGYNKGIINCDEFYKIYVSKAKITD